MKISGFRVGPVQLDHHGRVRGVVAGPVYLSRSKKDSPAKKAAKGKESK